MFDSMRGAPLPSALRLVWGVAAAGMLVEHAPWAQHDLLLAAEGYLGCLAMGLWALTGGGPGWPRKAVLVVGTAWVLVMACRLAGLSLT